MIFVSKKHVMVDLALQRLSNTGSKYPCLHKVKGHYLN